VNTVLWRRHSDHSAGVVKKCFESVCRAEHRRVGADAERQSRDSDGRERRVALHLSHSVADVAPELVQEYADAHDSGVPRDLDA
jgi:hypothetical protein